MRTPDILLSKNFLYDLNLNKLSVERLQEQIATGTKISKPSDSPSGTSRIISGNKLMSQSDSYMNNIQNGISYLNETSTALEGFQSDIADVMVQFTQINNSAENTDYNTYADSLNLTIQSLLDLANSQYDGKYLFAGTDHSGQTYGYNSDNSAIVVKVNDVSGQQKIKISNNATEKINVTGTEIFGNIVSMKGNLDKNAANGTSVNQQLQIYDAKGNEYNYDVTLTKTNNNTYSLSYDIIDSNGISIYSTPPDNKEVVFDPSSGLIKSIDGKSGPSFNIKDSTHNIDFNFDLSSLKERDDPTSINISENQKTDIFNTLMNIRDNLRLGIKPTDEQQQFVNDFNNRLLNKLSEVGNRINHLNDTNDMLQSQKTSMQQVISNVQDVDVAKAVMDLQNQDYLLQVSYKMSSMFLQKSLLNYL